VTGVVIQDTISLEILVSAITTIILVAPGSISLEIIVIHVALFHQMATTLELIHVIGLVIVDTTNQVTLVSVTTQIPVVLDNTSLEALVILVTQHHQIHTTQRVVPVIGVVVVGILDQGIAVSATTTITVL
jgi:hypothetical protein